MHIRGKKTFILCLISLLCLMLLTSCAGKKKEITIYSSAEDYRNEHARQMLNEKFPEYEINLVDIDTGSLAAKLAAEGKDTDMDIIMELETTYLIKNSDFLATLDQIDFSIYADDLIPESKKYVPWYRSSGAIVIDPVALRERGLEKPASYDDLLRPEYKGLISMPSPKSSGTGYIFLLSMVNERGRDAAFAYFDELAKNISGQGFTTSGSGPIRALVTGEAAIALGMTFHGAQMINEGNDFEILIFPEGAPHTSYSSAVIEGKQNADVMKVFDYICKEISPEDKRLYVPEAIFKGQEITMENFPADIHYADMTGITDIELKESLLNQWKY